MIIFLGVQIDRYAINSKKISENCSDISTTTRSPTPIPTPLIQPSESLQLINNNCISTTSIQEQKEEIVKFRMNQSTITQLNKSNNKMITTRSGLETKKRQQPNRRNGFLKFYLLLFKKKFYFN